MQGKLFEVQAKVVPEMCGIIERRYELLRHIGHGQPIGRRGLAAKVGLSERVVRGEVEFLKERGLVATDVTGMKLTQEGEAILGDLADFVRGLKGFSYLEADLSSLLGLTRVVVVAGDSDKSATVKHEMARAAARYLKEVIEDGYVVAVTGGTTLAEVADACPQSPGRRNITIVPARGALGEDVERQADTVAAALAKKLGGVYRLLNVPDYLPEEVAVSLANEPRIKEILDLARRADVVVHGVGTAEEMARRRRLPPEEMEAVRRKGAVAEAFGYYFDEAGTVVHWLPSVGLRMNDLAKVKHVVAVGGGAVKARALLAFMSRRESHVLVTDEGAARGMKELAKQRKSNPGASDPGRREG